MQTRNSIGTLNDALLFTGGRRKEIVLIAAGSCKQFSICSVIELFNCSTAKFASCTFCELKIKIKTVYFLYIENFIAAFVNWSFIIVNSINYIVRTDRRETGNTIQPFFFFIFCSLFSESKMKLSIVFIGVIFVFERYDCNVIPAAQNTYGSQFYGKITSIYFVLCASMFS